MGREARVDERNIANFDPSTDPDYFYCRRLTCWLKMSFCVTYQRTVEVYDGSGFSKGDALANIRALSCKNCEQGWEIKKLWEKRDMEKAQDAKDGADLDSRFRRNDIPEGTGDVPLCAECGENPVLVSKKTGRPIRRICGKCLGNKLTAQRLVKRAGQSPGRRAEGDPAEYAVMLDFSEYPVLLDRIKTRAKEEFRDIPRQIMYELHRPPVKSWRYLDARGQTLDVMDTAYPSKRRG